MKKSLIISYGILLILTLSTALIASSGAISKGIAFLILGISVIKFLLVAFQFMELKKANSFWKISLIGTLGLLLILIIGLK
ncbi:MAG TPA: cytochrome C oxidase subunit IV family protein [Flavobacterium alvei]|nr:cytochrome C oxidase subunit IV family protein [Flavobacterium alvei]